MQLKDYQAKVLERLDRFLGTLGEHRDRLDKFNRFLVKEGDTPELRNYCREAWEELNEADLLPRFRDKTGAVCLPDYIDRTDGLKRHIPNVCIKIPTGGGKTLLAAAAVERINTDYFRRQTGFVLWVVPSDAIYRQTWKNLANREHPYRQMLERASGGRVRMLEKMDGFTRQDTEEYLCVMLLMLQSSARKSKETLRMFRDSGHFTSFFPEVDDQIANKALAIEIPNLALNDLADTGYVAGGVSLKHSLGNALRLVRPIVIIDEGHKAYSDTARSTLNGFNPRFILELSATPNTGKKRSSNILVDVPGTALKEEEMIKLPINIFNYDKADWKHTLTQAHAQLDDLQAHADSLHANQNRYIRPIMLIRVDRTGKDQRDKTEIHAEDAREYLTDKLGVKPESIRVKSASLDELGNEDLLSDTSDVRFIITKDALREGWDCPFAYILAILSRTTAQTALTQMIGRVLREPEAHITGVQPLDECYVYCFDQEVQKAVQSVRKGLEEEGMTSLRNRKFTEHRIYANRMSLVKSMKADIKEQVNNTAESIFTERLEKGDICFRLLSAGDERLNWKLAETVEYTVTDADPVLRKRNGEPLERHIFEKVYQKEFNDELEKPVAWYLDGENAVKWWHRLVARHDYYVQGWQRQRVYPDFLACVRETDDGFRFTVLETKGRQLKGNDDTEYKRRLFDVLTEYYENVVDAGELELDLGENRMLFKMLLQDTWQEQITPSLV